MSSDDVPPARQCTMPTCPREAVDPSGQGGLCPEHRPDTDAGEGDDSTVSGANGEESREEAGSPDVTPTPEAEESADKYRRVYLDAVDRADREPWEFVEEGALREALDAIGFAQLLDNGDLRHVSDWRVADVSDDDERPRRRWYYPSGSEPRPDEFRRFHQLLTEAAPEGYEPHYFRVAKAGKDPATQYGSWKTPDARLTVDEAVEWMHEGGNVGIAGTPEDALINVDIDDDEATTPEDVPTSLRARSRSRTGWHTWYFDEDGNVPNIPTDEFGEIRTDWQYVVAPGSFVASTGEEIPDGAEDPGYYTVEDEEPVARIGYDDLPDVFHEAAEDGDETDESTETTNTFDADDAPDSGETSAVFDVEADDLVTESDASERFGSIFHASSTGANMSVSEGKLHCWRHGVAHGGLQALATLSDEITEGCRELGAAHKNSGAGRNRLKGDWRLVWAAWHEAKNRGAIPSDDPIPYRALRELAVDDGLLGREDLVERDTDDGSYTAFPDAEAYNAALDHVREEYGVDPGREHADRGEDYATDPTDLEATVDPRRAWDAAGQVTPADLAGDRLEAAEDGAAFVCPTCGDTVDVVRAVALDSGLISTCDDELTDEYPEAYSRAREDYAAPLPAYYTTSDAVAEFDAVLDVISETTFWHLDTDALESEITERDEEVSGDAVRALNPAWRESESEASVLVFESGTVWDADTERVLDAVRFVALDSGLIDEPSDDLAGERFTDAYQLTRRDYGAPLPRWEPATDGARDLTPMLPPSEEFVDAVDLDGVNGDALDEAREDVEALIGEATSEADTPTVVTALPALGKTTGTVKTAGDRPLSYLAPRKELQQQALEKAARWGVDAQVLPVFSEERVRDDVLNTAVSHVREVGKDRLRDRWAILDLAVGDAEADLEPSDIFEDDEDDDSVGLDRPTCETAESDHGVAWALAVHVARRLGYTPQEIHTQARGLFGAPLPCSCDDHGDDSACTYTEGWKAVRDPDDPTDLLVGSYVHGHVESVRTYYDRDPSGDIQRSARALVLDEFVGEAFTREFGDEALDFATWLASALREDVVDRRDMYRADLWGDDWVRAWLEGDAGDHPEIQDTVGALARYGALLDAREAAREILAEVDTGVLEALGLSDALELVDDGVAAFDTLEGALADVDRDHPAAGVARWVRDDVREPLGRATLEGATEPSVDGVDAADTPISGDLEALVEDAVEAVTDGRDGARETLRAAVTALSGGREGCRRLAAWASDGYAHPDAHHLLRGVATPTDNRSDVASAHRIQTDAWAFDPDATDGTVVDVVETSERGRVVVDRNDHGALLHTPPARVAGNGDECPLVGLDATGRAPLWSTALGERVVTEDIHDTAAERAEFLETALSLRVIQAADRPRSYEGDPSAKDTDGDVALLEALAEEYSGLEAPRQRGEDAVEVGKPAAITTKQVRDLLEADDRLDDVVAAWDNYGNVTGTNDLGDHQLAAILGSQHYGDHAIERFCALAGEEVDTSRNAGRGAALDYGNDLANEYLAHMSEDQTMQAILRFARGDSGATVVARTSALRDDLPVVGRAQVAETWNDTATTIAREYRRLGDEFTSADVRDLVDVGPRQVRRVLAELVDAGYLRCVDDSGRSKRYEPVDQPGAGEVDLPERGDAVACGGASGHSPANQYYTWNVRVAGGDTPATPSTDPPAPSARGSPPAPTAVDGGAPPG